MYVYFQLLTLRSEIAVYSGTTTPNFNLRQVMSGDLTSIPTNFSLQYGLYSSFMGCFMYVIFGTSKDIAVGPAAIVAFITAEHASKDPAFVVLLTFLSGIVIMLLGLLRLGKSIN